MLVIRQYDTLLYIIKLLHLAGCFESTQAYYANIKRIQTTANYTLDHMLTSPI